MTSSMKQEDAGTWPLIKLSAMPLSTYVCMLTFVRVDTFCLLYQRNHPPTHTCIHGHICRIKVRAHANKHINSFTLKLSARIWSRGIILSSISRCFVPEPSSHSSGHWYSHSYPIGFAASLYNITFAPVDVRRVEHARRDDDDDDAGDEQIAVATHPVAHHRELRPIEACRLLSGALRRLHVHVGHARQDAVL